MNNNGNDISGLRRMLREIADLAENASLTGSLSSGASKAVQRYNAILRQLVDSGTVQKGIFEELSVETTDYGQLGVDARLLASYLKRPDGDHSGEDSVLVRLAPFIRGEDLALLVKEQIAKGVDISTRTITSLAPFLGSDDLGRLVREHMIADAGAKQPEPPQRASPTPKGETLLDLAEQLRRPEISREERDRIAARISELAAQG